MPDYKIHVAGYFLRLCVTALLILGFWRWWRHTRHWPFLVLALCGLVWLTLSTGGINLIGNVADFGKTPAEVQAHDVTKILSQLAIMAYLDFALLALCAVAGWGLISGTVPNTVSKNTPEHQQPTNTHSGIPPL